MILESEFNRLAQVWREWRGPWSNPTRLFLHEAYQQIIGLGPPAIPRILKELQRKPDHWFWAFRSIAREDPVPPHHAGDLEAMANDWLRWGAAGSQTG